MKKILILLITVYRKMLARLFPLMNSNFQCRFYPTCSQYALDALHQHSLPKAVAISIFRIMRCQPFSRGGIDYI